MINFKDSVKGLLESYTNVYRLLAENISDVENLKIAGRMAQAFLRRAYRTTIWLSITAFFLGSGALTSTFLGLGWSWLYFLAAANFFALMIPLGVLAESIKLGHKVLLFVQNVMIDSPLAIVADIGRLLGAGLKLGGRVVVPVVRTVAAAIPGVKPEEVASAFQKVEATEFKFPELIPIFGKATLTIRDIWGQVGGWAKQVKRVLVVLGFTFIFFGFVDWWLAQAPNSHPWIDGLASACMLGLVLMITIHYFTKENGMRLFARRALAPLMIVILASKILSHTFAPEIHNFTKDFANLRDREKAQQVYQDAASDLEERGFVWEAKILKDWEHSLITNIAFYGLLPNGRSSADTNMSAEEQSFLELRTDHVVPVNEIVLEEMETWTKDGIRLIQIAYRTDSGVKRCLADPLNLKAPKADDRENMLARLQGGKRFAKGNDEARLLPEQLPRGEADVTEEYPGEFQITVGADSYIIRETNLILKPGQSARFDYADGKVKGAQGRDAANVRFGPEGAPYPLPVNRNRTLLVPNARYMQLAAVLKNSSGRFVKYVPYAEGQEISAGDEPTEILLVFNDAIDHLAYTQDNWGKVTVGITLL